jgi:hypothetical protein
LLGYNVLRELILVDTRLALALPFWVVVSSDSNSLEKKLNLKGTFFESEGPETFSGSRELARENTTPDT